MVDRLEVRLRGAPHRLELNRRTLDTARQVAHVAARGLQQALAVVEETLALRRSPEFLALDPQEQGSRLFQFGSKVALLSQNTQVAGVYPLREAGRLYYPQVSIPTFDLFSEHPDALVSPQAFLRDLDPEQVEQALTEARRRLKAAEQELVATEQQLDELHLQLAEAEAQQHPLQLELEEAEQLAGELAGASQAPTAHQALDGRAVGGLVEYRQ